MLVTSSLGYCVRVGVSLFFSPNLANWHTSTLIPFVIKISLILIKVGQAVNFLSSPKHMATPRCRKNISALSWKWKHWGQFLQKQKVLVFMNQLLHPWLTLALPGLPFFFFLFSFQKTCARWSTLTTAYPSVSANCTASRWGDPSTAGFTTPAASASALSAWITAARLSSAWTVSSEVWARRY